jgi:truncated hemoglobin YjbI
MATSLFEAIGGTAGCLALSRAFYSRVARHPVLRPLFPGRTFTCAIEEFSAFLVQFLGGPGDDSQRRWWLSLHESHRRFPLTAGHRDAWLRLMDQTLEEATFPDSARNALRGLFHHAAAYLTDGDPPSLPPEMAPPWRQQRALDDAVAAIRAADSTRAIALAGACSAAVFPGLLALMIASGDATLLAYVHAQIARDPSLTAQRYAGRTLLHQAAAAGRLSTVELLLSLGADPNVLDGGSHTPLYSVANEHRGDGSGVVRALVRAGARVDANEGAKRCTALHMAARRGNVAIAKALLDCGASLEARDTHGDTPLQRAINCRKKEVAELLGSISARKSR